MSGTVSGGIKASQAIKSKFGEDFYKKIGAKGGKNGTTGGFAKRLWCDDPCPYDSVLGDHRVAQCAGMKGGKISKRGFKYDPQDLYEADSPRWIDRMWNKLNG